MIPLKFKGNFKGIIFFVKNVVGVIEVNWGN